MEIPLYDIDLSANSNQEIVNRLKTLEDTMGAVGQNIHHCLRR